MPFKMQDVWWISEINELFKQLIYDKPELQNWMIAPLMHFLLHFNHFKPFTTLKSCSHNCSFSQCNPITIDDLDTVNLSKRTADVHRSVKGQKIAWWNVLCFRWSLITERTSKLEKSNRKNTQIGPICSSQMTKSLFRILFQLKTMLHSWPLLNHIII